MIHKLLWRGELREVELDEFALAAAAAVFGTNNEPAHDIQRVKDTIAAYLLHQDDDDEAVLKALAPALLARKPT